MTACFPVSRTWTYDLRVNEYTPRFTRRLPVASSLSPSGDGEANF